MAAGADVCAWEFALLGSIRHQRLVVDSRFSLGTRQRQKHQYPNSRQHQHKGQVAVHRVQVVQTKSSHEVAGHLAGLYEDPEDLHVLVVLLQAGDFGDVGGLRGPQDLGGSESYRGGEPVADAREREDHGDENRRALARTTRKEDEVQGVVQTIVKSQVYV